MEVLEHGNSWTEACNQVTTTQNNKKHHLTTFVHLSRKSAQFITKSILFCQFPSDLRESGSGRRDENKGTQFEVDEQGEFVYNFLVRSSPYKGEKI